MRDCHPNHALLPSKALGKSYNARTGGRQAGR